jgi:hypothetical protein
VIRPGARRPEVVRELLTTKAAIKKLGARKIAVEDAQRLRRILKDQS